MQTFLPYPDFQESAKALDRARLGKQRVECIQILNALRGTSKGWVNHPAVKMWRGYENALARYGWYVCEEWKRRGYRDSCQTKILNFVDGNILHGELPPWFGNKEFHRSHQSNLIRKFPEHYRQLFGFDIPDDLCYVWPVI